MPVDDTAPAYDDRLPDWDLCRDTAMGGRQVKSKGEDYLPRPDGMDSDAAYDAYVARAGYFNGFGRATAASFGMIFRREPELEVPAAMEGLVEQITRSGRPLLDVARQAVREVIEVGRVGLLVDQPPRDRPVVTVDEAERLGFRPFVTLYKTEDILDVQYSLIQNRRRMTSVRLAERFHEPDPDDEFGALTFERWRVLELVEVGPRLVYQQRLFTRTTPREHAKVGVIEEVEGGPIIPRRNGESLDFIPFVVVEADGEPESDEIARPPFLDVAEKTIDLYRTLADLEHGAWFLGFPQRVITGADPETTNLKVGASEAWVIPDKDAKAFILAESGEGLAVLERRAEVKKQELALLGGRILEPDRRQVEAAATALLHRQGEISTLQALALLVSTALKRVLEIVRDWQGLTGEVRFDLNQDYVPTQMLPDMVRVLLETHVAGKITLGEFRQALAEGEVISTALTTEEALREIAEEILPTIPDGDDDDEADEAEEEAA